MVIGGKNYDKTSALEIDLELPNRLKGKSSTLDSNEIVLNFHGWSTLLKYLPGILAPVGPRPSLVSQKMCQKSKINKEYCHLKKAPKKIYGATG